MTKIRDEVRERIAKILFALDAKGCAVWDREDENMHNYYLQIVDGAILSIPELAIVDRKAKLPKRKFYEDALGEAGKNGYKLALKDMAGYVEEVKE